MAILWDDRVEVGDMMVAAYLHDNGTHSLSFSRYGSPYFDAGFMFAPAHVDALIVLLQKMRDEGRAAEGSQAESVVAPRGAPTSPEKCQTCGAEPGAPCVYTGTEHPRYVLHQARREAAKEVNPNT